MGWAMSSEDEGGWGGERFFSAPTAHSASPPVMMKKSLSKVLPKDDFISKKFLSIGGHTIRIFEGQMHQKSLSMIRILVIEIAKNPYRWSGFW